MEKPRRITTPVSERLGAARLLFPLLFPLILLIFPTTVAPAQSCRRPADIANPWEITYADAEAPPDEVGNPQLVEKNVRSLNNSATGELEIRAHLHGVFRGNVREYEAAIRDIENQSSYLPRLAVSEVLCRDDAPASYARVLQRLSFRFLFFSRDYEYVLHYAIEDRVDEEGGGFTVWWVIAEPRDDQIVTTDGAWHFETVTVDGESYVYMGYATHTVFRERKIGLRTALRRFGERDIRRAMTALRDRVLRAAR